MLYTNKKEIILLEESLPEEGYDVVATFEELNGSNWLAYDAEQEKFYENNPYATPEEVWNKEFKPYDPIGYMTEDHLRSLLKDRINEETNKAILEGYEWNGMKIWLSQENQMNYKAAHDLAFQAKTLGTESYQTRFKFGTDEEPIYYLFETFENLSNFYQGAVRYVQFCYEVGWDKKDELNKKTLEELKAMYLDVVVK